MPALPAITVAEHILSLREGKETYPKQLIKLVYMCHGWMLGVFRESLVKEGFVVGFKGPVSVSMEKEYEHWGDSPIKAKGTKGQNFTQKQLDTIKIVVDRYDGKSADEMSDETHHVGSPWWVTRKISGMFSPIPDEVISSHFNQILFPSEQCHPSKGIEQNQQP